MAPPKKPTEPIEPYLDPLKFYNHGDNPVMKDFMKICLANARDGGFIDHRTFVIHRGQRYILARNWDDFMQRNLRAITLPRALFWFGVNTFACVMAFRYARGALPVGRFGIRSVFQTPFYHNFGPIGLAGIGAIVSAAFYTQYKTFKFALHKLYMHGLMGERAWYLIQKRNTNRDGEYDFSDNPLGDQNMFAKSVAQRFILTNPSTWKPTYRGPYGKSKEQEK